MIDPNDFQELVEGARTYRRYSGESVSEDVLCELVDAARLSPCGNNMQLLRFRVVSADDADAAQRILNYLSGTGVHYNEEENGDV